MKILLNINGINLLFLTFRNFNMVTSRFEKAQRQDGKLGQKEAQKKKITGSWSLD